MAGFMDALGGSFGGMFNGIMGKTVAGIQIFFWMTMIFLAFCVIGYVVYKSYKNKVTFTNPVTLTKILDNGTQKEFPGLRGGVIWNKGIKDFKVMIPKSKPHFLGYIPDFSKADVDGRLRFITSGDGTLWQQYETKWQTKEYAVDVYGNPIRDEQGNQFEYDLISKPVPRETKQVTINAIRNWRETVDKQKLTAWSIAIGAFVIMAIAHLVSLYIQTKIRCPTPTP